MSDESNQSNANTDQDREVEQPTTMSAPDHPPVRSQPIQTADQPVNVRRPETIEYEVEVEEKESNLGEYVKFGILAVILLGTPVVIALLIPLIFGQIVPTVLGSNLPTDTPVFPGDQVVEPDTAETPNVVLPEDGQTGIGGEATPGQVIVTPPAPEATPNNVLVHVVRSGDTLESIARQYGVTAAAIAAANNIQNPNQIFVGTVLIIPTQENIQ